MPPKSRYCREEVLEEALNLVREKGIEAVTARKLAERLNSSPKVLFGIFESMEELRKDLLEYVGDFQRRYQENYIGSSSYPPYKSIGMAYILFAANEPQLFRCLYMRDRSSENKEGDWESIEPCVKMLAQNLGISPEDARRFQVEMWVYVHGIAAIMATSYEDWNEEQISRLLTDAYEGLKQRFTGGKQ